MLTLFRAHEITPLDQLKIKIAQQIKLLPRIIEPTGEQLKILRYEFPCTSIDPLIWLHNQSDVHKIYWSGRDDKIQMGGIGNADKISGSSTFEIKTILESIEDRLTNNNPHQKFYGGFNFNAQPHSGSWENFPTYYFAIPEFEIFVEDQNYYFAFNIALKNTNTAYIQEALERLENIDFNTTTTYRAIPILLSRKDLPDMPSWTKIFNNAVNAIKSQLLKKVVLARESTFSFDKSIRPVALLKHLKDKTKGCFHFCIQIDENQGFCGASPERLVRCTSKEVDTEALAGTIKRGETMSEDASLGKKLAKNSKILEEHNLVSNFLERKLTQLATNCKIIQKQAILKLNEGQHLLTSFNGELKQNISFSDLLSNLHPTPAVGGSPSETALDFISKNEPINRGWYASPIGYVGYEHMEFCVGIRSGLVNHDKLTLFAGAGIVEGSVCHEEWEEIEHKIGNFLEVFEK